MDNSIHVSTWISLLLILSGTYGNKPPIFTEDLSRTILLESTPVGTEIGKLEGSDPEGSPVRYGLSGTDTFSVNSTTGLMTLVKPLDREVNDTLQFFVTLEDDVNNLVNIPISVIVVDENDNPPVFKNLPYETLVPEDTAPGSTVFSKILVEDYDLSGDTLIVKCNDFPQFPDSCSKFEIVTENASQKSFEGVLILRDKISFSDRQFYQLKLIASDGTYNSSTGLEIKVGDVQDTPPVFQGSLTGIVQEDDPIGTLVMTVHAKDGDKGMPRNIVYDLLTNPSDYFLLNSTTGDLVTAKPLDREALTDSNGFINLKLRAREVVNGIPVDSETTSAVALATVTIKDVNDEAPKFNQREYSVQILENLPVGTPLPNLNMTVTDPDIGINNKFSLRLEDVSNSFAVEPPFASGSTAVSIRLVNSILDYENPNHRKLIILVVAEETDTNPKLSSTATVTVVVTDANDNAPKFDSDAYSATVEEAAYPGEHVITITATDSDTGQFGVKGIVYELFGQGEDKFKVEKHTGLITVAPCEFPGAFHCLDYENKQTYYLTYKATDNGGRGQSSIVSLKITLSDSNDNPPVFSSNIYKAVIDEGSSKFEPSLFITARDADKTSTVQYNIIDGNKNQLFRIDPHSGEIIVANKNNLVTTNITNGLITLIVEASDGVFKSNCTVEITVLDVNDNVPEFDSKEYHISVPEDATIGSSVLTTVAHDADSGVNAEIIYKIEKGGYDDFLIDNKTGIISLISRLDYDRRKDYSVRIVAVDGGTPALTGTTTVFLQVLNVNDKPPFFSPSVQRAEVGEDAKIGDVIHKLAATDPDVSSPDALNYAASEPISAVDKNGKQVTEGSAFKEFFSIDRTTGVVTVANPLDRELAAVVRITTLVTDITAPKNQQAYGMLIITIVDVNDYPPTFLEPWTLNNPVYMVELLEEQPIGTIVGHFSAVDQESNIVSYTIDPASEYFSINASTGEVKTKVKLDYELTPQLEFTIIATDSGVPQLSSSAVVKVMVININDMDPFFDQPHYTFRLDENSPEGTYVGKVYATDKDAGLAGKIIYSLDMDGSNNFVINRETGVISVGSKANLDAEDTNELYFRVFANDSVPNEEPRVASAQVKIELNDLNDNSPEFSLHDYSVSIVESISLNSAAPILQLRAHDKDFSSVLSYSILSGNIGDVFTVDAVSGIMYPRLSLRNKLPKYLLVVQVSDGNFTDKANVLITVQAINENQPFFVQPSKKNSTIFVKENDEISNASILIVKARDDDTGENGRLTYHFKVNDKNVQETQDFIIDENSGELKAKVPLDREKRGTYELILVARDHGSTHHEALRFLTIVLVDEDDNSPMFEQTQIPYTFYVLENLEPNSEVGQVKAVDLDEGENARIYYYLLQGGNDSFAVDRVNGLITTLIKLDREKCSSYKLLIKASNSPDFYVSKDKLVDKNSSQDRLSITEVHIIVLDENDNAPIFSKQEYNAGIKMSAAEDEYVLQITASDADAGSNGSVEYFIVNSYLYKGGGNVSSGSVVPSPFSISSNGKLTTATLVAQYNQDRFKLEVTAKEKNSPYRESSCVVNVWVYEQNQLIKVILSRPPDEVHREKDEIIQELSNATQKLVVIDEIKYHVDGFGHIQHDWCDMYLHVVDKKSMSISTISDVLKVIDSQYDFLKDYYAGFAIENVLPAYIGVKDESFEPALAALIALFIVLLAGCISILIVCCCFRHWVVSPPVDLKQSDMLIKKSVIDDLTTTENPLWIEQKLKLYEEQELTMHVFCEPENSQGITAMSTMDRRDSMDLSVADNTYATIQHSNRKGSLNRMLSLGGGEYATLGGSVLPLDNVSSHSQQMFEAALGFQGSTFQVPENTDLFKARTELRLNKDGQPEFISELM